jgi:glucose-6-phosphate 1-dehydrogenase
MNPERHLFVVMGATGDLAHRKLIPALARVLHRRAAPGGWAVLGVGTDPLDDAGYRRWAQDAVAQEGAPIDGTGSPYQRFFYQAAPTAGPDYPALRARIEDLEGRLGLAGNRVFYLALPPRALPPTLNGLGASGLNRGPGWTRLVVEKPFGTDLESARALNATVHRHFAESQVYRIDHYLGKETVQNLLAFRFANPMFEAVWNRDHVEQVEILVAEDLGVGRRAGYYEAAGALRDMVQNHLTQLLALVAMEPPNEFEAERIRNEKVKVIEAIAPLRPDDVVYGQYDAGTVGGAAVPGYREEPGVAADSITPTFAGLRVRLDTWRWNGVPFYLRTGKRFPKRLTQVAVTFRPPPLCFFQGHRDECDVERDVLLITLQPDEGFSLGFNVKSPGRSADLDTQNLHFRYGEAYGPLPEAYETLLLDIIEGDQSLFVRADETEASWAAYGPVLDYRPQPHRYAAGTWGPPELDQGVPLAGVLWMGR